jgi:rubrerythrin
MRASLLHPISAWRNHEAPPVPRDQPMRRDFFVERVREAGGPVDRASYTCACGYVFAASVSTSVRCPHCGAWQAW